MREDDYIQELNQLHSQSMEKLHHSLCRYLEAVGKLIQGVEKRGSQEGELQNWASESLHKVINASETILEMQKLIIKKSGYYNEETSYQWLQHLVKLEKGYREDIGMFQESSLPQNSVQNTGKYHLKKVPFQRLDVKVDAIEPSFPWISYKGKK